jgi:Na+/H+-dicarboxylate symporter
VLIGLALGIAAGVFFGERAASLQIIGDAFVRLLQMTVMPFIAVSLIAGLGKLERRQALELGLKGGAFLVVVWGIILLLVAAVPIAFPPIEAASFFSSSLIAERESFDFLALYIPSNPIYSLGHNVVPAVVLFSAVLGIALIGVENKSGLIAGLDVLVDALARMSGFVSRLAPLGVFALIGSAAGTISLEELERLQVYLVTYTLLALALTFWILPGLVSTMTPLRWKEIVPPVRDAIITAFAAGNLLIEK